MAVFGRLRLVVAAGLNSGRPLDESYRRFAGLAVGHVSSAIADATALESARHRAEQLAALDRAGNRPHHRATGADP